MEIVPLDELMELGLDVWVDDTGLHLADPDEDGEEQ